MPTYVVLIKWTDQGVRNVKDVVAGMEERRAQAERAGLRVHGAYFTQGAYDGVAIVEAPDEETMMAALLGAGAQGNERTETLRAFSAEEMTRILAKLP